MKEHSYVCLYLKYIGFVCHVSLWKGNNDLVESLWRGSFTIGDGTVMYLTY